MALVGRRDGRNFGYVRQLSYAGPQALKDKFGGGHDGTGSQATQQRHVRQAKIIQTEIAERWQRETPWAWQRKHLVWFLEQRLKERCGASQYYYLLTVRLLARRLEKPWIFNL